MIEDNTKYVGIVYHPRVLPNEQLIGKLKGMVADSGYQIWELARGGSGKIASAMLKKTILVITLGGDGTFLHGMRLFGPFEVPLLGINFGRLGFLCELQAADALAGIGRFFSGDYVTEKRLLVQASVVRDNKVLARYVSANEVAVHKGGDYRLIRINLEIDGVTLGSVDGDGLLIASPTGSTAYALALGGPVLDPVIDAFVVVPINPFVVMARPIVVPASKPILLRTSEQGAVLSVDGVSHRNMAPQDAIVLCAHPKRAILVRFNAGADFYFKLRDKLHWGFPLVPGD
jgi:NAD+ kinase